MAVRRTRPGSMYQTATLLRRQLRVRYPAGRGRVVLRTELDWDRDLAVGSVSEVLELDSTILGRKHLLRIYLPPGYRENTLRRHPVLYMQDGRNLFFPEEAFGGREWQVDETLHLLDGMNAVDRVIVVGIYSGDRMGEYTKPGYEAYARSVVEELKPEVEGRFRVFGSPRETGVIGSSLGGVVSFYMAWEHPQAFGFAACMSSPFSHRDDLIDRVLSEPKHTSKFYLDSGWPGDNYEVTLAMAMALSQSATGSPRTSSISSSPLKSTTSGRGAGGCTFR
jgi:predicted alpha/beta superfamily hydrolase